MTTTNETKPYPATSTYELNAFYGLGGKYVSDATGEVRFTKPADYETFVESGLSVAEYLDEHDRQILVGSLRNRLPNGDVGDAIGIALGSVLARLQDYSRERVGQDITDTERYELMRGERELNCALAGIVVALDLYSPHEVELGVKPDEDYFLDTHAWYESGKRARNSGYLAEYDVCSDLYYPDEEDHADELTALRQDAEHYGEEELWPDEFHHPGKLEIRVNPAKRIEFVYTPSIQVAQRRHASRSEVTTNDGRTRAYDNNSLSIRVDLDPTAPAGIALDVGRSEYEGERDGRRMSRNADLLGSLLSRTAETGSHEYSGFSKKSAEQFREFAERFAIQLDLQQKEYSLTLTRKSLSLAALRQVA